MGTSLGSASPGRRSEHTPRLLDLRHPMRTLTIAFCMWKALLFLVIVACPGPGYDTSTALLASDASNTATPWLSRPFRPVWPFVRWDAIYFVHIAEKGYVYEQEWAFGYPRVLALVTSVFTRSPDSGSIALVGVALSHVAHYLSVVMLHRLSVNVFGHDTSSQKLRCLLAALLHIISPAGAFLSAPFGEPVFSFFNFAGFYLYSAALLDDERRDALLRRHAKVLTAAVLFAIATVVRSNGILGGFLFAYDAVLELHSLWKKQFSLSGVVRLAVIVLGGSIVASGMIVPQYLAWKSYCTDGVTRPWCTRLLPSIYGWVQAHYWDVGFLRYWTLSNLPLFLLATPMLLVLCQSAVWALQRPMQASAVKAGRRTATTTTTMRLADSMLIRLAVPQAVLAVLALTSYHVQIINRISSGYPVWYWYLAAQVADGTVVSRDNAKHARMSTVAVQAMMIYALVQAVLFGSFLPPA